MASVVLRDTGQTLSGIFEDVTVWWLLNPRGGWRILSQDPRTIEILDVPDDRLTRQSILAIHTAGGVVRNWPCMIRIPISQANNAMPAYLDASEGGTRTWRSFNDLATVAFPVISPNFYVPATLLEVDSRQLKSLSDAGATVLTMAEFAALQAEQE